MSQNAISDRIAQQTMARRGPDYASEVRRLLDAGLDVMRACGTASRPRVSDIVAAAGLSNDAFYRHFASKAAHAVVGALSDHLWQRTRPTRKEIAHIVEFCLAAARRTT